MVGNLGSVLKLFYFFEVLRDMLYMHEWIGEGVENILVRTDEHPSPP